MTPEREKELRKEAEHGLEPDQVRELLRGVSELRTERDKWKKFYDLAIKEHLSLGEEMTLRRQIVEMEFEIEQLRRKPLYDHKGYVSTEDCPHTTWCQTCLGWTSGEPHE